MRSFNLVTNPWINALYCTGRNELISLQQLFFDWSDIAAVNGHTALSTLCIDHFLSLLMQRVTGGFQSLDDFKELWNDDYLGQKVNAYLSANQHLFYIDCPDRPFLQVPAVKPFIDESKCNTIRLSGGGKEDIFGFTGTPAQPQNYDGSAIAQFLLTQNFAAAGGLTDSPNPQLCKSMGLSNWGNAGCSAGVLWNKVQVALRGEDLRQTLLLNMPVGLVPNDAVAPWERVKTAPPENYIPTNAFEAMSALTRNVLLLWTDGTLTGVWSGKGDFIPSSCSSAMPNTDLMQFGPTVVTSDGEVAAVKAQKNQPIWTDLSTFFAAAPDGMKGGGIKPAPIMTWWRKLQREGFIEGEVNYVVNSTVSQRRGQGNIIATHISEICLPISVFDRTKPTGKALFRLFKYIADVDRCLFRLNDGGKSKKKTMTQLAPLSLIQTISGLFANDQHRQVKMMGKYPVSNQFITLAEVIFMDAMNSAIDDNISDLDDWLASYQRQILALAAECWRQVITSLTLTSPSSFTAAGYAQSQFKRLHSIYKNQIVSEVK